MHIVLNLHEFRVIGCLIEKQISTPEQYPLSLNALINACNQKSNRDPVLSLDESTVQEVVEQLIKKHQVSEVGGYGSRVPKYQQRFCNSEYGTLKLSPPGAQCHMRALSARPPDSRGAAQPCEPAEPL